MKILSTITVPQETVNDEFVIVTEIPFKDGDFVKANDIIIEIESSKENSAIESNIDGYIKYYCEEGEEVKIGRKIAEIYNTYKGVETQEKKNNALEKEKSNTIFSKSAEKLIIKHNIKKQIFNKYKAVKENDVKNYLNILNVKETERSEIDRPRMAIIGASGQGADVLDIINFNQSFEVVGFIDKKFGKINDYCGLPILGNDTYIPKLKSIGIYNIVIAALWLKGSKKIENIFKLCGDSNLSFPTIIHPSAKISPTASIGAGCQIFSNVLIGAFSKVGKGCVINNNAIISHDAMIGDFTFISPGAAIAGNVKIGRNCIIGMNSSIYLRIIISDNTIIKNNESVIKSR